jgi:RHS repeat-associated protein
MVYIVTNDETLPETTQYLLYDGHNSTRQLVSDTGAVQDSYSYDGYGVMLGDSTTPNPAKTTDTSLLYSGEQYDGNLDQYYNRARYYNQNNGTFNRVDPYSGNMQDPQSLHKYAYVHNNPVNNIDPTGMFIGGITGVLAAMSIGQVLHNIYDGLVLTVQTAIEISIQAAQTGMSMKAALAVFLISAVLIPLIIMGAVAGIGKLFGPTAAKWASRFVDFAEIFLLFLSQPQYMDDLPTLDDGKTNGSRSRLRNNMIDNNVGGGNHIGDARAHHIIAYEFKDHEVIKTLNMDINHQSNGVMLHKEHHTGSHWDYRQAMRLELDRIKTLPKSQWKTEVIRLRNSAGYSLYKGAPLTKGHGSTVQRWTRVYRGK